MYDPICGLEFIPVRTNGGEGFCANVSVYRSVRVLCSENRGTVGCVIIDANSILSVVYYIPMLRSPVCLVLMF